MLAKVLAFLEAEHEEPPTSLTLCEVFGLSVGMAERLLEALEDAGHVVTERAGSACGSGGCGSGGCSSGGCSTKGPAAAINALAEAAKARKEGVSA